MKTKYVVSIVAGGLLGAGAVVTAVSELRRLKKVIEKKNEIIKDGEDLIESGEKYRAAQEAQIKNYENYVAALNEVIEKKDAVIKANEKQIAILQGSQEHSVVLEPEAEQEESVPPAATPSEELELPKKKAKASRGHIFQYDTDFNVVAKYGSVSEACEKVGLKYPSSIRKVVRGDAYTAAGYFWSEGIRPLKKFPDSWKTAAQKMKNE